ncbi:MAG TPA: glycine zipper family protein [Thermoanaerobaculia bacterium]|nr:glycine zipper family protein [Thermoanaerobaculia bacterium]
MADDNKTGQRSTTLEAPTDVNDTNPSRGTGQTPLRGKTGDETLGTSRTMDATLPQPPHVTGSTVPGTTTTPSVSDGTNPDPLTGEVGSHPIGTGVGAAGGAATGAAVGGAVGGPVGALLGAAIGGIAGGFAGKGVAEAVNPTEEDAYWRSNYANRPYAQGRSYDQLRPAYEYGWNSRVAHHGRNWNEAESDLQSGWDKAKTNLGWHEAKGAVQDAWNRVDTRAGEGRHTVSDTNDYWRNNFSTRPYASGRNYADYEPAYKYGQEAYNRYPGRRFEDVENDLSSGWERAKGASKLTWQEVKDAVKDAWYHVAGEPAGTRY